MKRKINIKKVTVCIILLFALILGVLGGFSVIRPNPRPTAEDDNFLNIKNDIAQITITPHTAGSLENYAVRDMIVARTEELGFMAQVLSFEMDVKGLIDSYTNEYENGSDLFRKRVDGYIEKGNYASVEDFVRGNFNIFNADVLNLDNILVKVEGASSTGAIMFVSHYDHVKDVPGAADDALAVACMLNLLKDMSINKPANDVYFLFTDAEESGLLGAKDFVETQTNYVNEIDALFNFEARGNSGAMLMFETSGNDYDLVKHFKNNIPQPVTMSIATAIYAMMPNGTDYTEFKNAGYNGLNFAMIEGDENYHQPTDTLENLNKDTAWQYYKTVTALGEHFGNMNLQEIENIQEALYFPLPLVGIVIIPGLLGYIIGFIPLLLAIFLVVLIQRQKTTRFKGTLHMVGVVVLGLLPAVLTIFFFAGSYMFSVPAILFLISDIILTCTNKKYVWIGILLLTMTIFITAFLYLPLLFLIQIALKLWYATIILALVPLIPVILYGKKAIKTI